MIRSLLLVTSVAALLLSDGAQAVEHGAPSVEGCIASAADAFAIDPLPLRILHRVEAGSAGTEQRNDDGSTDLGPMQVNTVHLPELARFGIGYADLRDNRDCANVLAAAYLYKRHLVEQRGDVAMALAHYHSRNPRHALRYLERVQQAIAAERRELLRRTVAAEPGRNFD